MKSALILALATTIGLAACTTTTPTTSLGPNGLPLPQVYKIRAGQEAKIQFRFLDSVNTLRSAAGASPLALSAQLNAAALTHSRDMAVQNRAWHFGSDGSSPLDRVARTGYIGTLAGENISETYETELETLSAWMDDPNTRAVVLNPEATDLGFQWVQEANGKIWWTMVTATKATIASEFGF